MFLLAALTLAPPTVSLRLTAPVRQVVAEVARQAGQRIEVSPSVPADTLIVDLRDAEVEEGLRRIAWAVHADVRAEGGGYRLVAEDPVPTRKAFREWLIDRNRRLVERLVATELKDPDWTVAARQHRRREAIEREADAIWSEEMRRDYRWLRENTPSPAGRALVRLLRALPPERLIPREPETVQHYALRPVGLQAPLPGEAAAIVRIFQDEQTRLTGETIPVAKVIVTTQGFGSPTPSTASIELYAANGSQIAWASLVLPRVDVPCPVTEEIKPSEAVELGAATRDLYVATSGIGNEEPAREAAVTRARQRVRYPDRFDPLGTLPTDVWVTLGRKTRRQVVVNPPDLWLFGSGDPEQGPPLREWVARGWHAGMKAEAGWLVGRPPLPRPWWGWQTPRVPLGRLFRWPEGAEDILDVVGDLAAASAAPPNNDFHQLANMAGASGVSILGNPWHGLRTYGLLPGSMRRALRNGATFRLGAIPNAARDELVRWVRSSPAVVNGRSVHPSEAFAPVPRDGILEGGQTFQASAVVRERGDKPSLTRLDAEALGARIAADPSLPERLDVYPDLCFRVRIAAALDPLGSNAFEIQVPIPFSGKVPMRLADTPLSFRQAVERGRVSGGAKPPEAG
jgi:hypothetical protein